MALLLLASLKAAGVAALLPLAYDSLLAAAVAMVPPVLLLSWCCAAEACISHSAVAGVRLRIALTPSDRTGGQAE